MVKIFIKILRIVYLVYAMLISLLLISVMLILLLPFWVLPQKNRYCISYFIFHWFFKTLLLGLGIVITKHYDEKSIRKNKRCVYVSNHLSYLDAIVVTAGIENVFRPLGKAGITTIPIIGFAYKQYVILVDRKSIKSKKNSLKEMKTTLAKGHSVLLFPEGTFYDIIENPLSDFKDGAFHLAIENKVPVQPILLCFTRERLHPKSTFSLSPGKVQIHFLEAVNTLNYELSQTNILKCKVYDLMKLKLENLQYPKLG